MCVGEDPRGIEAGVPDELCHIRQEHTARQRSAAVEAPTDGQGEAIGEGMYVGVDASHHISGKFGLSLASRVTERLARGAGLCGRSTLRAAGCLGHSGKKRSGVSIEEILRVLEPQKMPGMKRFFERKCSR